MKMWWSILWAILLGVASNAMAGQAEYSKAKSEGISALANARYADAERWFRAALSEAEAPGGDELAAATALEGIGRALGAQGKYEPAEQAYQRTFAIRERILGPNHSDVGGALNNLAATFETQGKYAQAEPLYKRALTIGEKILGPNHEDVARGVNNLAILYYTQGKYSEAEPLFKRALSIREKNFGPDHPDVANGLNNLASLYDSQGMFAQAEPLYKRALGIREKSFGYDHPDLASSLNNLALFYEAQGKHAEAEPLFKRALAINEKVLGYDHPDVASILNNLALIYEARGQYAQAEPLYKRALAIYEKALGPDHSDVARGANNLGSLYNTQGKYAEAELLFKRALAINEKALGLDHPEVALNLQNLASLYDTKAKYTEAEPLFNRALAIYEKALGPDHPKLAVSLSNLATHYSDQGKYRQAEPPLKRALAINEKALGPDHPDMALSLNSLAALYRLQGQYTQALNVARRATSIYRNRVVAGGTSEVAVGEAFSNRHGFLEHLSLLSRNPDNAPIGKITEEAFQVVQLAQASGTASAIAKMATRYAKGDDALAGLVKRKQDASDRRTKKETQLVSASSKPPKERIVADEQRLRNDIAVAGKELEAIDNELTHRFPDYQELTRPEPASVNQIQALLKPGEAMLVYMLGGESFLWVVKSDSASFMPIKVDAKDVAAKVAIVRGEMEFDVAGNIPRVNVGELHELYKAVFAPALPNLVGVKHVMVVPSGPLQSLPFGMLITSPPLEIKRDADYVRVDWLAKHYAFSVLPSVSSIQAFRQFAKASVRQEPFAGFGDPLIGGADGLTRGKRARVDIAAVFRNLVAGHNAMVQEAIPTPEIADVETIRNAQRLPETADEIRAMAKSLNGNPDAIWLQKNATEIQVKSLDLSKYRTIAFATHGVMAGEVKGVGESGLILTPPQEGTTEDDGYLSASEISRLNLNADWVILSACNTAAADGTPGAEGLSGLAKAFFYAGARSLLVSHWSVESKSAMAITTRMFEEAKKGAAKSEALRRAMMALANDSETAHPAFWAPFVVVGEGLGGRLKH